jgi:hypothetical protein
MFRPTIALLAAACLAACARAPIRPTTVSTAPAPQAYAGYNQAPPFSRLDYAPFARADAIAIALREWRVFGQPVDDDPPGTRPPPLPDQKPERYPGLWERVGEYWWESMDSGTPFAYWTGKHDANGQVFPANQDAHYAWSAAFISYIMRIAGAKDRFPYSASHSDYINAAKMQADAGGGPLVVTAERPDQYAPQAGDLICLGRGRSAALTYNDLPTSGSFPGHCDFVVAADPGQLTVLGGNVDDAVTEKHIPLTPSGMLADPVTGVVDTRYPWMVVLRVAYDQ